MKKYTMAEIINLQGEELKARAEREEDLRRLAGEQMENRAKMQAAAEAGDLDAIGALREEGQRLQDRITVTRAQLSTPKYYTREDAAQAYKGYAADYNKRFRSKLEEYHAARHELFAKFRELIQMQNDALKVRAKCVGLIGEDLPKLETLPEGSADITHRLKIHGNVYGPDAAYFAALGYISKETLIRFHLVQDIRQNVDRI